MSERRETTTGPTVLVVDDDRNTADLYADYLDGYAVSTAYSGGEALDVLDETIDVVLLDRRMSTVTGDDVLESIRERKLHCRVVMVTAVEPDADILDLPFDDYLVKPVSADQIRDTVSQMHVRNGCDDMIREMFAIASKMATVESKMSVAELEASPAYAALEAEFDELRTEVENRDTEESMYVEFTDEKLRSLLS
ncbi:HoxA-like transcriptional regulator [Halorubrum sp. DM2]|uniref:response regulator n=1 Tax=unclassified Halorubrum TaxID=2642239 RepID=UPI00064E94F6|nr:MULTISPECIES: response regulator [unclassified Halorubrum]VTT87882.1 HoxA-like transcriptional regulator [Halorubrum sp. DM2]